MLINQIDYVEKWYNAIYSTISNMDKSHLLKIALKISELYNYDDLSNELKFNLASLQRKIMKYYLLKVVNTDNISSEVSKFEPEESPNTVFHRVYNGIRKLRSIDKTKLISFIDRKYEDFQSKLNVLYNGILAKIHNYLSKKHFRLILDCSVIQFKTKLNRCISICAKYRKNLSKKLTMLKRSIITLEIVAKKHLKTMRLYFLMNWIYISNKIKLNV